ncbi:HD domain-containing protein [Jeotgalibacillus sp. ET6]|uniref:HD domain-containing protein n=1 Tax=Jeotgalibacillus sp. ET6 TaxID=3037260 RepID=UPI00241851D8|nr:HD domain-containing protein [Jeotgalibacillus sp. ET6]MDG5470581.1 HD domain-containing protein [Jeotgalibacillus sp. ET6]
MKLLPEHIAAAENCIRPFFERDHSGHDWDHIQRVRRTALFLCKEEGCSDELTVDLIALLHDVGDDKLYSSQEEAQSALQSVLQQIQLDDEYLKFILEAVQCISYSGGCTQKQIPIEAAIVRDADRLDAMGAIGIARAFTYGGAIGSRFHDEKIQVRHEMTKEAYRTEKSTVINHFHEKLLKLKDLMLTDSGKKAANHRHKYMEEFVKQFLKEWGDPHETADSGKH